jgi:crotonobetainyl-CoA:carnitine CoA-transferase CaiB-like acyl-CoA transferase
MLQGIRVVELSNEVAGAFAGRLLANYGADVVVIEPPAGHAVRHAPPRLNDDPDSSIMFAYLGAGKRSVSLELDADADRSLALGLIERADVVIDSHAPGELAALGIDLQAAAESDPHLVVCAITPFGQWGPRSGWRATALTAAAAGGQMSTCGEAGMPPLKTAGSQAQCQAGLHAFSAISTALYAAAVSGTGDFIDLSMQEVQVSTLEGALPQAFAVGSDAGRSPGNAMLAQWGIHPCRDGYVGLAAMPRQSFAVYDRIGHPELKDDPAFASGWSPEANAVLQVLIPEWTEQHTAREIFELASEYRAPFAMIPNARELLDWPALQEIGFWRTVEHPALGEHPVPAGPIDFDGGNRGTARRAPLLGEHTEDARAEVAEIPKPSRDEGREVRLPLDGIRVIDATAVWAGPYGTRFLADMGAEVIKVEGPSFADPVRTMTGAQKAPEINASAYFNEYNRNKLGLSLDVKQPEGMKALLRLVAKADVFVENWSSGVAERLGLGYEALKKLNPNIVYVSMPGFGHTGGDAARVGFGPTIEQMGGLVALQGYGEGPPRRSGISYGDPVSGTTAAGAVALGLLKRQRTGESTHAVVPQRDGIVQMIGEYVVAEALGEPLPTRIGSRDVAMAPHNIYAAADTEPRPLIGMLGGPAGELTDGWVTIAVDSEEAWAGLKQVVGDGRLDSPRFATMESRHGAQDELDAIIAEWAATRDADEAAAALQAAGVCAAPVLSPLTVTQDEHLLARNAFLTYDHPVTGTVGCSAPAWRMQRRSITSVAAAPLFGQHTDEVLTRVAGYSAKELSALREKCVITDDLLPTTAG